MLLDNSVNLFKIMYDELRNIIEGIGVPTEGNFIQTVLIHLRKGKSTSRTLEKSELINKKKGR
jgi:hypothetical protein